MTPDQSPETRADDARVSVFYARLLLHGVYIVDDGGEVSLVDRETLTSLLQQLFVKETNHD